MELKCITKETIAVSVMAVHNETGLMQDIEYGIGPTLYKNSYSFCYSQNIKLNILYHNTMILNFLITK